MVQLLTGASDPNGFMSNFIGSTMGTDAAGQGRHCLYIKLINIRSWVNYGNGSTVFLLQTICTAPH